METQNQVNLKTWETMNSLNKQCDMLTDCIKQLMKITAELDKRIKQLEEKQ